LDSEFSKNNLQSPIALCNWAFVLADYMYMLKAIIAHIYIMFWDALYKKDISEIKKIFEHAYCM